MTGEQSKARLQAGAPLHVGIIMDGNGRWAERKRLPRSAGHEAGMRRMVSLVKAAQKSGVKYLTVYALSTENFSRPEEELEGLYSLIKKYFSSRAKKLIAGGAAVKVIGNLSLLPCDVREIVQKSVSKSPQNASFTFILAIGYGGRDEIVQAANAAIKRGEEVDEEGFSSLLYTSGVPDPDFIIRTGGEIRLSNFLLWQAAYAELYFTDTLFPDFTEKKFAKALEEYLSRVRRFGGV